MLTSEEFDTICNEFMEKLGEHADSIQILASFYEADEGTYCRKIGIGNFYARQGMAREFLQQDQAQIAAKKIGEVLNPSEED